jgi:hypothetical protein
VRIRIGERAAEDESSELDSDGGTRADPAAMPTCLSGPDIAVNPMAARIAMATATPDSSSQTGLPLHPSLTPDTAVQPDAHAGDIGELKTDVGAQQKNDASYFRRKNK